MRYFYQRNIDGSQATVVTNGEPIHADQTEITDHPNREEISAGRARWNVATQRFELVPLVVSRIVSVREFLRRFDVAERVAIRRRRAQLDATSDLLDDFFLLLTADTTVDLDNPDVVTGLVALVRAGLLSQARAAAILGREVPP